MLTEGVPIKKIATDNYEIFFDDKTITAYSAERIVFEPKGWQVSFRSDLQSVLKGVSAAPNERLLSVYGTIIERGFFDTENVLFYNIGTAAFRNVACYGVVYETLSMCETKRLLQEDNKSHFKHYYSYQVVPYRTMNEPKVASWSSIPISPLYGEHKPFEYWYALRSNLNSISLHSTTDVIGSFGLEVQIEAPESKLLNLANSMKPMFDGIICAFHKMSPISDQQLQNLSEFFHIKSDMLIDDTFCVLGDEYFVSKYRSGVKWNPQDDRCKSAYLSIGYGAPEWKFSGTIFTAE